jgi:hypothetical protein
VVNAVDLDIAAPQAERPFIVYLRARRSLWLPCDLEPEEEAQMLEDIEGYVERIAVLHDALYVGHSTTPQARCFVLYAPEQKYLRRGLERTFSTLGTYGYDPDIASGRDGPSIANSFCPAPTKWRLSRRAPGGLEAARRLPTFQRTRLRPAKMRHPVGVIREDG